MDFTEREPVSLPPPRAVTLCVTDPVALRSTVEDHETVSVAVAKDREDVIDRGEDFV